MKWEDRNDANDTRQDDCMSLNELRLQRSRMATSQ